MKMRSPIMPKKDLLVEVKTGDKQGAGTDCKIWIILHDNFGRTSLPLRLHSRFLKNCRNSSSHFRLQSKMTDLKDIVLLEFWIEKFGIGALWYVDHFKISNVVMGTEFIFPVHRWVSPCAEHFFVEPNDASLPQETKQILWKQRKEELKEIRQEYRYIQNISDGPMQAAMLPSDETFSEDYYWNFAKEKAKLLTKTTFVKWTTKNWKSIEELKNVTIKSLGETESMPYWNTDEWFGLQRVQGVDPYLISLCKSIPENLDVSEETVSGLLGHLSLKEALDKNRIFICDLKIIDGIPCHGIHKLACPIALFFLKSHDVLLPIAIQLQQQKEPNNPVFTPKDHPSTWLVAKMFYNNAEAQHHQGVSHLGLTHLLMEGICICSHRHLSPSHPIFKLIAPHFLFLIAINRRGLEKLISPGGWVDLCMTQGIDGIYEVIRRGINNYNFYTNGNVREEVNSRGVLNPAVLPYYPYRDDAISLFETIRKYVATVVRHYYDSADKVLNDWELKEWRLELSRSRENGGVGLPGIPGNDTEGFSDVEELIETITIIISTCSVGHSAANFQQYDQYGFVPNYPGVLMQDPPTIKREYSESEIVDILPDMQTTLSTMVITKLLSSRGTKPLGHFTMQYLYHPVDVQADEDFKKDLLKLSFEMKKRNLDRKLPFLWLDPEIVPNSISI